jgi:PKD repeat protein
MKNLLILVFVLLPWLVNAQNWRDNLPEKRAGQLTLNDYKDAFNQFCQEHNVVNGYMIKDGKRVKMSGYKQFKRWEWYWESQVDAHGNFPDKTAAQALKEFERNSQQGFGQPAKGNWINLGTNSSMGGEAGIGRVNCIAFHPTDINTYWIGTPAGGLWVTRDNGENWEVLTDNNEVLGVSDIVIPSNYETSKTIYIATGDKNNQDNLSIGVLKSTDDGNSWKATGLSFDISSRNMIYRLLIDPNNDSVLIAATSSGVYKTVNGGLNWNEKLTDYPFVDMEFKPDNFQVLFGSTADGRICKTSNGGEDWYTVGSSKSRTELAVSPANCNYVYAISCHKFGPLWGIYKSTDGGNNFTMIFDGTVDGNNLLAQEENANFNEGGQGWYDLCIEASPTDENVVLIGGINTWRTKDGGDSWEMVNHWEGRGAQAVHADKHMLKYRSNGDLFECNDGGVYLSSKDGDSFSWLDKTNGTIISQIYKLGVAQQDEQEIITGLQDNGTKLMVESSWFDVKPWDGMECIIDNTDKNIQYATWSVGRIARTTDHWETSTEIIPTDAGWGAWVTPYVIDPNDQKTLYAGYTEVWKTTNRGDSWTKITDLNFSNNIRAMAISPSNSKVIWVTDHYSVYRTEDGGVNWKLVSNLLPGTYNKTAIAIKADDPDVVWITLAGYGTRKVYRTKNGGKTWSDISEGMPPIPANTVVQDASVINTEVIYVGTDAGVYQKIGTQPFTKFSKGLPNVKVTELEIFYHQDPTQNKLRAATYGRGLWQTVSEGVFAAPIASFNAEQMSIGENQELTFNNTTKYFPDSLVWYFEGGTPAISHEESPVVSYAKAGNYMVSLVAFNKFGKDSVAYENYISVYNAELIPPLNLTTDLFKYEVNLKWQSPTTVSSTLSQIEGGYKVFRNNENIASIATLSETSYTDVVETPGYYTYYLTAVYNESNQESNPSNYVSTTVYPVPVANFEADVTEGFGPLTVTFNNVSENATAYYWDFGDGNTSQEQNPSHQYSEIGVFNVSLIAYSEHYTDTLIKNNYISVDYPEVVANFEADVLTGSKPLTVTFTNTSTGAKYYKWNFGDEQTSTDKNPEPHIFTEIGDYTIKLMAWNEGYADTLEREAYISVVLSNTDNLLSVVQIYPNPTSDKVVIDWSNFKQDNGTYEIVDLSGKVLLTNALDNKSSKTVISLKSLAIGSYLLRIKTNKVQKAYKIEKQ